MKKLIFLFTVIFFSFMSLTTYAETNVPVTQNITNQSWTSEGPCDVVNYIPEGTVTEMDAFFKPSTTYNNERSSGKYTVLCNGLPTIVNSNASFECKTNTTITINDDNQSGSPVGGLVNITVTDKLK